MNFLLVNMRDKNKFICCFHFNISAFPVFFLHAQKYLRGVFSILVNGVLMVLTGPVNEEKRRNLTG